MMRLLLAFFILALSFQADAELKRRYLELELEEVEGATGYHVQVTRLYPDGTKKKPFIFKLKNNQWAATLNPGKYEIAVRSVDERGVPGDWSAPEVIEVKLHAPNIISPLATAKLQSDEKNKQKIQFEWEPVQGVERYLLKVYDATDKLIIEEQVSNTSFNKTLEVAKNYQWEVAAIYEQSSVGDFSNKNLFTVVGAKLDEPIQKRVEDINTNLIEWKNVELAEKYEILLEKKNEKGEWVFVNKTIVNDALIKYKAPLSSGEYRYKVIAQAEKRIDSDPLYHEFKTNFFPNRSPAAIEQIKSEQSFETKSRLFALASYFISMVNYSSQNYDTGNQVAYSAIGGTGRLGAGVWFKEDGMWGLMATVDMSGFTVANQTQTYISGQFGAAIRYRLGALGQLRAHIGASYRELPTTVAFASSGVPQFTQTKVKSMGPTASISIARGISRKLGVQINGAVSESLMDMGTPNGLAQEPRTSIQYGLLGSLKLSDSLVGFMGYAYRSDFASYRSTQGSKPNEVSITGHYLNFMLEYGF